MSRILTAGTVVAGGVIHRPGWLEIVDGRVAEAGSGPAPGPVGEAYDEGLVVPGFVDIHVHGGGGGAYTSLHPDDVARGVAWHRAHGTTTTLASLVTAAPDLLREQVALLADLTADGTIAGSHLEGPWLAERRCGAHDRAWLRDPDRGEIDALLAAGRGTIRMVTIAPERRGALAAIRQLAEAGVTVALGHTDADFETTRQGIEAGARVATHLFNAMRPLHHRDPGPIVALLDDPRISVEVILDGLHLHPAVYRQVLAAARGRVALVTDAMAAAGMPDGPYVLGGLSVEVAGGTAHLQGSDTIAGGTASTGELFRNAVRFSGLGPDASLLAAVEQTSAAPARAIGLGGRTLSRGEPAELTLLDSAHRVLSRTGGVPPSSNPDDLRR